MIRSVRFRGPPRETPRVRSWHSLIGLPRRRTRPGPPVPSGDPNKIDLKQAHAGRGWTLRQRLLLIITIALLPIAVLIVLEGVERVRRDVADVHDRLVREASAASEDEQTLLGSG